MQIAWPQCNPHVYGRQVLALEIGQHAYVFERVPIPIE